MDKKPNRTIIVEKPNWKAAYAAAGVSDTRPYLNGVCLDCDAKKIIGTDGHMLVVAPIKVPEGLTGQYIVPHVKGVRFNVSVENIRVSISPCGNHALINRTVPAELLKGRYPVWQRVQRVEENDCTAIEGNNLTFDPRLVAKVAAVLVRDATLICKFIPGVTSGVCDLGDCNTALRVEIPGHPDIEVTCMPGRF